MGRLYLIGQGTELAERRKRLPSTHYVEIWPDLFLPGTFWISEETKMFLEEGQEPLTPLWSLAGERVPIYYGPGLRDLESLPREDSVRLRVLSAHGIACAWVTSRKTRTVPLTRPSRSWIGAAVRATAVSVSVRPISTTGSDTSMTRASRRHVTTGSSAG